jgi:general secretion pathway protein D
LAQIPILKYLFGQVTQDKEQDETIFAITPHIIRGTSLSELNQRAIDIGTANVVQLREVNHSAPITPAGQSSPGQTPATPAPAIQNSNQQSTPAPGTQGSANFLFDPGQITVKKGNTFVVNLLMSGAQNVYSVPVQMNYDPSKLQLVNVSNGGFLSQDGQAVALVKREDPPGTLQITAARPPGSGGVSGQGAVLTLTFEAKAEGQTPLTITRGGARDPGLQAITVNGAQASVTVQ